MSQDRIKLYMDAGAFMAELRETMRAFGVSQRQLALEAGMQPQHVSKYFRKRDPVRPRMETMVRLDAALQRLVEELEDEEW